MIHGYEIYTYSDTCPVAHAYALSSSTLLLAVLLCLCVFALPLVLPFCPMAALVVFAGLDAALSGCTLLHHSCCLLLHYFACLVCERLYKRWSFTPS